MTKKEEERLLKKVNSEMSEIDKKIAALEAKLQRQQITLLIFKVVVIFTALTNISLIDKFNRMLDILEEIIHFLALLTN